jgi:hypothetical protein
MTVALQLDATLDDLGRQAAEHARRAKLELLLDVRALARQALLGALLAAVLAVAHLLLCAGLAAALAPWLGAPGALGLVGAANAAIGATGLAVASRRGA